MDKREFLVGLGGCTLAALVGAPAWARWSRLEPGALAREEDFWSALRGKYRLKPEYANFENGYYSMMAEPVLEAFVAGVREVNLEAARYMRKRAEGERVRAREALARVAGAPVDEIALTRNTTESLDLVIAGLDWKRGDEVVCALQDYGTIVLMLEQQAARHGVVVRKLSIPLDPASDEELVALYAGAMSERTRLVLVPHMVNLTGHILPVAKIAGMARARGAQTMVDGAHAFAHLEFAIPDLGCDYYAASLHKWLGAPLGCGLLWVKRERIAGLWPLLAPPPGRAQDDITRLNHLGTWPAHSDLGLRAAIAFHEEIGIARKEARLRHLQQDWTARVRGKPRIRLNTPTDPARSCAIANVAVEGLKPLELEQRLHDEHGIFVVGIDTANVQGVRVTPHLYTSRAELDRLVAALLALAGAR